MTIRLQTLWKTLAKEAASENKIVIRDILDDIINVEAEPHDYFNTSGHYIIDVYSYLAKSIADFSQLGFDEQRQKQIICYIRYNRAIRIMHVFHEMITPYRPEEFTLVYDKFG